MGDLRRNRDDSGSFDHRSTSLLHDNWHPIRTAALQDREVGFSAIWGGGVLRKYHKNLMTNRVFWCIISVYGRFEETIRDYYE